MKAAVLRAGAHALAIEEVPEPYPGPGEAVVRVAACGLCRTDLHYLHGTPTAKPSPLVLGHEVSGTVEVVGTAPGGLRLGQRVLLPPVVSCGRCTACLSGRGTLCSDMVMFGNHRDGGFAEFVAAPGHALFPLPDALPLEESCIVADAVSTPYHALANRMQLRPGETVAIFGCGGVGLAAVQLARSMGGVVVAVDVAERKLDLARRFGAETTVDASREPDVAKAVRKATGGGADAALEVIGDPGTIRAAFEAVRWGGRVVVIGYTDKEVTLSAGRLMFREIEIKGSLGCGLQDFPRVIALAARGAVDVRSLVTHRFGLDRIGEGFDLLERGSPELVRAIALPQGDR